MDARPNILFAIADDWSWPHASAYGEPEIATPHFDRVSREGMLFHNAFTCAPQCSPNRAATLTGRHIWQIAEAGTHGSIFPNTYPVFTELLEDEGYFVGFTGKGWSPGDWERGGWSRNPAGRQFNDRKLVDRPNSSIRDLDYAANFEAFLAERPEGAPFYFWFGCYEPHRSYEPGTGRAKGKNRDDVRVPQFLPDTPAMRDDILDYYAEIEWFDDHLGRMLAALERIGELDNTLVIVTSDNGMPFPRAKANLYEHGTHVPLAVRWPEYVQAGTTSDALVSFVDIAPTILGAAGAVVPETMVGQSFVHGSEPRDHVLTGRERHTHARYDNLGYPGRAIRTEDYLYIWNVKPDRWPAGDPDGFEDIDACPAKDIVLSGEESVAEFREWAVGKRPEEELFAVKADPFCLNNLAGDAEHEAVQTKLRETLKSDLETQGDPRVLGYGDIFESYPRVSHMRPHLGGFAERGEYNPKYQVEKP
jgi:N-sulfoglucosamine sulfohydrolase